MVARCVVEGREDVQMKWKRFIDAVSEVQAHASVLQPITVELITFGLLVWGLVGSQYSRVQYGYKWVDCNGGYHDLRLLLWTISEVMKPFSPT